MNAVSNKRGVLAGGVASSAGWSALLGAFALLLCFWQASVAQADPAVSQPMADASVGKWVGGTANANLGGGATGSINAIGDINGDGVADVAVTDGQTGGSVDVLFGRRDAGWTQKVDNDLPPANGYRIKAQFAFPEGIGDQNGDGVDDLLIASAATGTVSIVYGVSDPSTLPECAPGSVARCQDTASLGSTEGYTLTHSDPMAGFGADIANAGDVNGDDIDDILVSLPGDSVVDGGRGSSYLIFGGRTAANVDVTTLPATEAIRIDGFESGASLGAAVNGIGDIDEDGKADLALSAPGMGANPGQVFIVYGKALTGSPFATAGLTPDQGFRVQPPVLTPVLAENGGDINGDGRDDLVMAGTSFTSSAGFGAVVYGPESALTDPLLTTTLDGSAGYGILPADSTASLGAVSPIDTVGNLGDLNGDGIPDQVISASGTKIGSSSKAGAAYVVLGQRPGPADGVKLGDQLVPGDGVALIGAIANEKAGEHVSPAGDVDDDGVVDFFASAPGLAVNGNSKAGAVYVISGAKLAGRVISGKANDRSADAATLNGSVSPTGRDSTAYFEYGTTDAYGSQTADQAVRGSNGVETIEASLSGLEADTEYHYRLVSENDLGIESYGADRTFRTRAVEKGACEVDPKAPGCPEYNHCEANPNNPECKTDQKARLSGLIVGQKTIKVKRGKKGTVRVTVVNTGNANATGVKICASGPKKMVSVPKCKKAGSLASGKSLTWSFKAKVKKKARKGKKIALKLKATAAGLGAKTAKVSVRVR